MSTTLKIKLLNQSMEVSFDVSDCTTDICASLSMKDYPITPENFKVARDNKPIDKWIQLDPLGQYTFAPADPVQTSTPKKQVTAEVTREEEITVTAPTPKVSGPTFRGFLCKVPGCGIIVRKPWNHLYQSKRHSNLSSQEKKDYLILIRAAGAMDTKSCCEGIYTTPVQ